METTDEWIKKTWYNVYIYIHTHAMKYYSIIDKNEIFAGTWMDLETVILSEISQKETNRHQMISLICRI